MNNVWLAPAKLNLFLHVIKRQLNGYHLLWTLFRIIDYSDRLFIKTNNTSYIDLVYLNFPTCKLEYGDNLIIRAAKLLRSKAIYDGKLDKRAGVYIGLDKKIPIGGGLGGGSSDAATTLVALNNLWRLYYNTTTLAYLGLQLGADVPLFIYGRTSLASGIGDKLTPVILPENWYIVIYPNIVISTSLVFTQNKVFTKNLGISFQERKNTCENFVRENFKEIDELIKLLSKYALFRLTGTGSCIFAEFNNEVTARYILNLITEKIEGFIFLAKGLNISPLYNLLI